MSYSVAQKNWARFSVCITIGLESCLCFSLCSARFNISPHCHLRMASMSFEGSLTCEFFSWVIPLLKVSTKQANLECPRKAFVLVSSVRSLVYGVQKRKGGGLWTRVPSLWFGLNDQVACSSRFNASPESCSGFLIWNRGCSLPLGAQIAWIKTDVPQVRVTACYLAQEYCYWSRGLI